MKISVVIPTYKRRAMLERCLGAVLAQTVDARDYEIVVSDDAPEPDMAWFLLELGEKFGRFEIGCVLRGAGERRGPAAARNRGWRKATGDVVAFTDDDCVPSFDWLEEGLKALEGAHALQGKIVVPVPEKPTDYELNASRLETATTATANFFCRRKVLEDLGGFDERFGAAWREDSDLHFSLLERGLRVAPAPRAVVIHPVRPESWGVGLRLEKNNYYEALLFKKHPRLYREIIGGPPWRYYAALALLAAGASGWLSHGWRGLRWGLAAWAAWTSLFCLRRLRATSKHPLHLAEMAVTSALIPAVSVYWRLRGALAFRVVFW
jgi:glycosyltransferase involved in cell wall biosynthesis